MLIVTDISNIPQDSTPIVLAMGCFDGVHIGHQTVISTAVEQARKCGGEAWVYTFDPHPAKVLVPDKAPPLISAEPCRLRQIEALGVQGIIKIPFTREFAAINANVFLSALCKSLPTLSGIVCGEDWSFGRRADGEFQTLELFCSKHGLTATAVPPVLIDGERVSSTHIRQALLNGDIPLAEHLLGRPFSLFGTVVPGRGVGSKLGYPTANIDALNELIPAPGVYAAYTRIQRTEDSRQKTAPAPSSATRHSPPATRHSPLHPSAVFIGERATFNDSDSVIESHLLDFDGELYGQSVEVVLVQKVRNTERFCSKEALIEQIGKDIAQIRETLTSSSFPA